MSKLYEKSYKGMPYIVRLPLKQKIRVRTAILFFPLNIFIDLLQYLIVIFHQWSQHFHISIRTGRLKALNSINQISEVHIN